MKNKTLKLVDKKWQHLVFIISIGLVLFNVTKFNLTQNSMDNWDFALLSLMLPVFIGLIAQLYWNNKSLTKVLFTVLSIGSALVVLMALYFVGTTNSKFPEAIAMLIIGLFLLFTSITVMRGQTSSIENNRA